MLWMRHVRAIFPDSRRRYVSPVAGRFDLVVWRLPPRRSQGRASLAAKSITWGSVLGRFRPATTRVRDDSSFAAESAGAWLQSAHGSCPACREARGIVSGYELQSTPDAPRAPKER